MLELKKFFNGKILDIGGGGEGVIGRLYGRQVIAIDCCQVELDEVNNESQKILMDATKMEFPERTFDYITSFYTLMFMNESDQQKTLCEATRVLKETGEIHIWDCHISSAYPNPFCVDVDVCLPDQKIHTTYGIVKQDVQSEASIKALCQKAGLQIIDLKTNGLHFYMRCKKAKDGEDYVKN